MGDAKDTIPIPEDGSVRFVDFAWEGDRTQWLDYACERKGRFVGLQNKDGSTKTECGIHVAGAEKTFDRDLWEEEGSAVRALGTRDEARALLQGASKSVVVVYAPWCDFCISMEPALEQLAKDLGAKGITVRGALCST
jgi:thiol-disulfide isomerase/thioredoxin